MSIPQLDVLTSDLATSLRCPATGSPLRQDGEWMVAVQDATHRYPIVRGIPILIDDAQSVFPASEIKAAAEAPPPPPRSALRDAVVNMLPDLSKNYSADDNIRHFVDLVRARTSPKVLIIGCGTIGIGVEELLRDPTIEVLETDVFVSERTNLCCDAHNLPLADGSIDAILIQGVLGQVLDPWRCSDEMRRVLTADGLVYAETPFVQQNCGAAFDFNRFTPLGHRRLFRNYETIREGIQGGPGMVMAWSYKYLLWSTTRNRNLRTALHVFARLTGFWLPWLDRWLLKGPGSVDAASGVYFLGRRSTNVLTDKELVRQYKGCL